MVEIKENDVKKMVASCSYIIKDYMEVTTNNKKIQRIRNLLLNLYGARVPNNKKIKELKEKYNVEDIDRLKNEEYSGNVLDDNCVLCGLCVTACETLGNNAISTVFRGPDKKIGTPFNEPSKDCIGCGSCAEVCPTGAIELIENDGERIIWNKKFELIKCRNCGKRYMTQEEHDFLQNKLGNEADLSLCADCRHKEIASGFIKAMKL
jgi:predicted molibdopterin-dependent oxidoreductase YjgC